MVREEPAPCRMMVQDALGNDALAVGRLYINKAKQSTVMAMVMAMAMAVAMAMAMAAVAKAALWRVIIGRAGPLDG